MQQYEKMDAFRVLIDDLLKSENIVSEIKISNQNCWWQVSLALQLLRNYQDKITKFSQGLRRKRKLDKRKLKASRRWKKQRAKISKIQRQVANQRQDWTHKVAAQILSSNSMVATEKLNLKGMTRKAKKGNKRKCLLGGAQTFFKRQKAGLNRNLLDVAIGMLRESIKYKVIEAGGVFLEAPTQKLKPTQRCNNCWELTPKTLSDRVHICSYCGHTEDRDKNCCSSLFDLG